jgi:hypothetical protein
MPNMKWLEQRCTVLSAARRWSFGPALIAEPPSFLSVQVKHPFLSRPVRATPLKLRMFPGCLRIAMTLRTEKTETKKPPRKSGPAEPDPHTGTRCTQTPDADIHHPTRNASEQRTSPLSS